MAIVITDKELEQLQLSENEFRLELAVFLYHSGKFSLARAARFTSLSRMDFQAELSRRQIPVNYSTEDLHHDLDTLKSLNF